MPEKAAEVARAIALPDDVLVVEDNIIIALDAEECLISLGVKRVRTAARVKAALNEINIKLPDYALLDVDLNDETSLPVAAVLQDAGVPFAFTTGYGDFADCPERFSAIPRLSKPYTSETLGALFTAQTGDA